MDVGGGSSNIYAWNDGEDDGGTQIRLLIITGESLGLRSRSIAAALNCGASLFGFIFLLNTFSSPLFNVHQPYSIKRREEEEKKECDVHVIQQPLCSLFCTKYTKPPFFFCCLFWHSRSNILFRLIMFRSYIDVNCLVLQLNFGPILDMKCLPRPDHQ